MTDKNRTCSPTKQLKIAVIGGGSSYTPELLDGFIHRAGKINVREITLADIPEGREKAETVLGLGRRMFERAGLPIKLDLTLDRREALVAADFVVVQIRVGGLAARVLDEKIPLRHGLIGQETTGAGGFAKALRTVPVVLEIAREMETLCPGAWLINFTNPSGIVTEALHRHSKVRSVGLCNVPINMETKIAKALQIPREELYFEFVGLNHLSWIKQIYHHGRPILNEVLANPDLGRRVVQNIPEIRENKDLIKSLGMIPSPYLQYFYWEDRMLGKEQAEAVSGKGTRGEQVQRIESELFDLYRDLRLNEKPPQLSQRGGALYSQAALSLMESLLSDAGDVHVVNAPNRGAFPDLSFDAVVETNCLVNSSGVKPLVAGPLPLAVRGLVQQVKAYEELTVQAAVTGSREIALAALLNHPLTHGFKKARDVLNDLLEAHRVYLPNFFN